MAPPPHPPHPPHPAHTVRFTPGNDGRRAYDVVIGAGILKRAASHARARTLVVQDENVPEEFALAVAHRPLEHPAGSATIIRIGAGEDKKSFESVEQLIVEAIAAGLDRSDSLLALGGGITTDLTGFAASIYKRGIPWIACPTTLLAMVDASVGGKTAVNLRTASGLRKNMAGTFHHPSIVLADIDTLRSLDVRELRCGLAECVKHALIAADWGDPGLLDWTESNLPRILAHDPDALIELITRNVAIKAAVVAADETESSVAPNGGRMALNLGHTFAHALEVIPSLELKHGEAVALGLIAASRCAQTLHLCPAPLGDRLEHLLGPEGIGLPIRIPHTPENAAVVAHMQDDKKTSGGRIRLILPTGPTPGRVTIVAAPPIESITAGLDAIRQS